MDRRSWCICPVLQYKRQFWLSFTPFLDFGMTLNHFCCPYRPFLFSRSINQNSFSASLVLYIPCLQFPLGDGIRQYLLYAVWWENRQCGTFMLNMHISEGQTFELDLVIQSFGLAKIYFQNGGISARNLIGVRYHCPKQSEGLSPHCGNKFL